MKKAKIFFLGTGIFFTYLIAPAPAMDVRNAVVKIFVTSNSMDFYQPWQSKGTRPSVGSGCIISGNRILTNAHVVTDQTFIQVRKHADPRRYTARLLAIGHECDLAVLTVDDAAFFDGIEPIAFGELPHLQDTVSVLGYPTGGDKISITEGVVSRIELRPYAHSRRNLLTVQIDAAINPGNSGGPVIQNGRLVGIAMQVAAQAQNIGYIIPIPIVNHFFTDLNNGRYDGFPILGIELDGTENPALRRFYSIDNREGGVLVTRVTPFSPADGILKEGDVILALDDVPIAEDGTFVFRSDELVFLSHLITSKQINELIQVTFVRGGSEQSVSIPLHPYVGPVPNPHFYERPTYYIYGGLVFSVLSADLFDTWGDEWGRGPFSLNEYRYGTKRFNFDEKKQVVVLLSVLPDEINIGYHQHRNVVIDTVNGKKIISLEDLVMALAHADGDYTVIETESLSPIILDAQAAAESNARILARYGIPAQHSPDVTQWLAPRPNPAP